ncbi:tellurium resistance protein [Maritimibacter sp. UBA3975]|uniref:SLAC1 family transporter n=1 Tax=Maritimibacter sp. UBA3975 TaxID=1946833 RepID=UPI000C0A1766|nr:tellurium resistance protein [Maritimibacter sp. UBA3975]MAM60319.1 tellurium resistance protein [Maritimibacter sp.]|tara:strand:- start:24260 stop:25246 length:987 start_codon:yes stop_codon:yes gene_type:complete
MKPPDFGVPPKKPGLWRRTPPALFTPVFGLFGLAVAWRRAAGAFAMPYWPAELVFGAVTLLFVFVLVAYGAKVLRRPGVVVEDLRVLPGRAGLAAMALSGMLMALGLIPMGEALAAVVLALAVAVHAIVLLLVIRALVTGPQEGRVVTPVWHLTFVGFIVSPIAAVPLGWDIFSAVVFWGSLALATAIWGASVAQFARRDVPAPLRPLLAIHLAPASVLGSVALLLGYQTLALGLGCFAVLILAVLLLRLRWVLETGFSPLWGAFTFPLAAFSSLMQMLGSVGAGEVFRVLGGLALVAATLTIPVITWKIVQLWAKGQLAVKTNAAEA